MTMDDFMKLVQAQKASGKSVKDYCKQVGMSMSTYCYWKRKFKDREKPCGLVPVQVSLGSQKTEVQSPSSVPVAVGSMLLHFPNGVKVEFKSSEDSVGLGMLNHMYTRYVLSE